VLAAADGWLGLQNGIYLDGDGRSRSAVRLLTSADGLHFTVRGAPFLRPGAGWKRSHVYAVDARAVDGTVHLYFNARDDWHWTRGREAIGLAVASPRLTRGLRRADRLIVMRPSRAKVLPTGARPWPARWRVRRRPSRPPS
jgi:hypothetical protein